MEARGEIRGGRFVAGFTKEQFAWLEAVDLLRSPSAMIQARGKIVAVAAADPLNLTGVIFPAPAAIASRSWALPEWATPAQSASLKLIHAFLANRTQFLYRDAGGLNYLCDQEW